MLSWLDCEGELATQAMLVMVTERVGVEEVLRLVPQHWGPLLLPELFDNVQYNKWFASINNDYEIHG
jgi:hypothetical protein